MADIMDLLLNGDPAAQAQRAQAAALRGQQFQTALTGANDQAHSLDLLNFAAQNANNPTLAKSVAAIQGSQQEQYTPQKLDKGVMIPGTGDYEESPGVADEKEADRETRRLQAASVEAAREQAASTAAGARIQASQQSSDARVLAATIAAAGAADRAAARRQDQTQAEADRQQRMFQTSEGRLATLGRTTNLPATMASSTELVNRLQPYVDAGQANSIPGLTTGDRLKAMLPVPYDTPLVGVGQEGAQNMAMAKSAILDQLKTQVGLGGTNRARDEQLVETLSGARAGSKDFIDAYNNAIQPRLENQRKQMLGLTSSWTPDQWDQHMAAGGIDYRTPIPTIKSPGGNQTVSVPNPPNVRSAMPTLDPAVASKYGL